MRRVALTALAAALVWVALVAPEATALPTPLALSASRSRDPFSWPVSSPYHRDSAAGCSPPVGVLLALLLLIRVLDWAFRSFFYRPYNP